MPTIYKVLAQSSPSSNATVDVYTVPSLTNTIISTMMICNRATVNAAYNIAIRTAGASLANQHYIAYDAPITALDTVALSLGITLGNTDIISVYSANSNLSFSVFGTEIT